MIIGRCSNIASTGSNITASVTVGSYTSIGPYVQMHTLFNHPCIEYPTLVSTAILHEYPPVKTKERIIIGSDVWIGRNAILLGDITIGHGAIIGAFAVVARDIPPYSIVVGNPAKIIRYRFTPEQIKKLLEIQWWNWSDEMVKERKDDMKDINRLIAKFYK